MSKTATAEDIALRSATPEDVPAILDFMRLSLGEGSIPRTEEYWRWKHIDNPFGASPVLLAEADDQIVGLRAFMRWTWRSGLTQVPAVRAVDTATHPGWRGRGIFTRLTLQLVEQMRDEGVGFVFNTPNEKSRPGYLKMGWQDVGRVSLWVRPLRPLRSLRVLLRGNEAATQEDAADLFEPVEALLAEGALGELLVRATTPDARYETPRTIDYLRWRYQEVPGFTYRALWDLQGGEGAALIFRLRDRRGLCELSLSEVFVSDARRGVQKGRDLLCRLTAQAPADYMVAMAASRTPARRALMRALFLPALRLGPHFTVRPLSVPEHVPDPVDRAHWQTSIGDLELF